MTTSANKLYRTNERVIAGVCGGIAEHFGLDRGSLRIITLLLILFGGLSLWVYIILWCVMPNEIPSNN
ncbi:MAG: PspC domain-containing protein [Alistipes sp.]